MLVIGSDTNIASVVWVTYSKSLLPAPFHGVIYGDLLGERPVFCEAHYVHGSLVFITQSPFPRFESVVDLVKVLYQKTKSLSIQNNLIIKREFFTQKEKPRLRVDGPCVCCSWQLVAAVRQRSGRSRSFRSVRYHRWRPCQRLSGRRARCIPLPRWGGSRRAVSRVFRFWCPCRLRGCRGRPRSCHRRDVRCGYPTETCPT